MERGSFTEIEHTADLGLDLSGPTPAAVLEAAQRGLIHVLFGETPELTAGEERGLTLEAATWADLLVAWLEALYRLLEGQGFVPLTAEVETAEPPRLDAVVAGARPGRAYLSRASELKAVTWHELAFDAADGGWRARVIFDV